jgi:hypothetical protein
MPARRQTRYGITVEISTRDAATGVRHTRWVCAL